jgi:hypothetical protein
MFETFPQVILFDVTVAKIRECMYINKHEEQTVA